MHSLKDMMASFNNEHTTNVHILLALAANELECICVFSVKSVVTITIIIFKYFLAKIVF